MIISDGEMIVNHNKRVREKDLEDFKKVSIKDIRGNYKKKELPKLDITLCKGDLYDLFSSK